MMLENDWWVSWATLIRRSRWEPNPSPALCTTRARGAFKTSCSIVLVDPASDEWWLVCATNITGQWERKSNSRRMITDTSLVIRGYLFISRVFEKKKHDNIRHSCLINSFLNVRFKMKTKWRNTLCSVEQSLPTYSQFCSIDNSSTVDWDPDRVAIVRRMSRCYVE